MKIKWNGNEWMKLYATGHVFAKCTSNMLLVKVEPKGPNGNKMKVKIKTKCNKKN